MRLAIPEGARLVELFPPYTLYAVPGGGPGWPMYRLMLPPETPVHRGQTRRYNLVWGVHERRFRFDRETKALRANEPALFRQVEDYMREVLHPVL